MNLKGDKVASAMIKELGNIFLSEVNNEEIKKATITFIKVTNDLSFAKIYFTTLSDDKVNACKELNKACPYFRKLLADRMRIRHIPDLKFVYDESIEYGKKIEDIIDVINND